MFECTTVCTIIIIFYILVFVLRIILYFCHRQSTVDYPRKSNLGFMNCYVMCACVYGSSCTGVDRSFGSSHFFCLFFYNMVLDIWCMFLSLGMLTFSFFKLKIIHLGSGVSSQILAFSVITPHALKTPLTTQTAALNVVFLINYVGATNVYLCFNV